MALKKNIDIKVKYILDDFSQVELGQINDNIKNEMLIPVQIPDAYVKINSMNGTKEKMNMVVDILNQDKTIFVKNNFYAFTPTLDDSSDNFIKQGYAYLKTLPEYEGAIDVLEEGQTL